MEEWDLESRLDLENKERRMEGEPRSRVDGGEPKLIIAADRLSAKEFYQLMYAMEEFRGHPCLWGVKLNDALVSLGSRAIRVVVKEFGFGVMGDLKCSDIDTSNNALIEVMRNAGASIITIQTTAGCKTDPNYQGRYLAGITVLTTWSDKACMDIYGRSRREMVLRLAAAAQSYGYRYLVCGAPDLADPDMQMIIKNSQPQALLPICPGIRPEWSLVASDNQVAKATPSRAVELGARRLVVGRPIVQYRKMSDLKYAIERTLEELERAWKLKQTTK